MSRRASLAVERRELAKHMAAVRLAHFRHVAGGNLSAGMTSCQRQQVALAHACTSCQLDDAGLSAARGQCSNTRECSCMELLDVAGQALAVMQAADIDAAARVARLQEALTGPGGMSGECRPSQHSKPYAPSG